MQRDVGEKASYVGPMLGGEPRCPDCCLARDGASQPTPGNVPVGMHNIIGLNDFNLPIPMDRLQRDS